MLFAGWEVRIVKNFDRGLENAAPCQRIPALIRRPAPCPVDNIKIKGISIFFSSSLIAPFSRFIFLFCMAWRLPSGVVK